MVRRGTVLAIIAFIIAFRWAPIKLCLVGLSCNCYNLLCLVSQRNSWWLALLPHSKKVLSSNYVAEWGLSVRSLQVLLIPVSVSCRHSGFVPQSKDIQFRATECECEWLLNAVLSLWQFCSGSTLHLVQSKLGLAPALPQFLTDKHA